MRKIKKHLILILFFCVGISMISVEKSYATEMSENQEVDETGLKDENPQRLEKVTGMNENGIIYTLDIDEESAQNIEDFQGIQDRYQQK